MRRKLRCMAAALCAVLMLCGTAAAYDKPVTDMERLCSLSLEYAYPNVTFRVYRAGDLSQNVILTPSEEFAAHGVSYEGVSGSAWLDMAETLAAYAAGDKLAARAEGKTDGDGRVKFEDLEIGLYLVVGEKTSFSDTDDDGKETTVYITPQPFLICLPNWRKDVDTDWVYDVTAAPKYERSESATVTRRVLKVWKDGSGANRPAQITVDLLKDGEVYDTQELTAANNWRWQWEELDNSSRWQVVESKGGQGYQVSVSQQGITFVVTNSLSGTPPSGSEDDPPPKEPPTESTESHDPPPENPGSPEEPLEEFPDQETPLGAPDLPGDPSEEPVPLDEDPDFMELDDETPPLARLPQTGQLWWPVPLLAIGGVFFFLLGCVRRRGSGYEEE